MASLPLAAGKIINVHVQSKPESSVSTLNNMILGHEAVTMKGTQLDISIAAYDVMVMFEALR